MTTTYMKLPYEDRVLRPDALRPLRLSSGIVGFTLDVRLNYYRGLPLSAIENLELSVDGVRVPDQSPGTCWSWLPSSPRTTASASGSKCTPRPAPATRTSSGC